MDAFDLRLWAGFAMAGGRIDVPATIDHVSIDSRRIYSANTLFVALKGASSDGHAYLSNAALSGAKYAIVSRDCYFHPELSNLTLLKVDDPLKAFQEIAGAYRRQYRCRVIGITGSYGKTMVKDFLFAFLNQTKKVVSSPESFNSQIGVPLSLFQIGKGDEVALIEAGISMCGEMDRLREIIHPTDVVVTHVGKKYRQSLGSVDSAAGEMGRLAKNIPKEGWLLVPDSFQDFGFKNCFNWAFPSLDLPHAQRVERIKYPQHAYTIRFPGGELFEERIRSGHAYFLDLVNTAMKAAWLTGCPKEEIKRVIKDYVLEPMKTEVWESSMGVTMINEPYCGDPQSVDLALRNLDKIHFGGKKIFIFGGMRAQNRIVEQDYSRIGQAIAHENPEMLLLVGNDSFGALKNEVKSRSPQVKLFSFQDYSRAFAYVKTVAKSGDTLLLKGPHKESLDHLTSVFEGSIQTNQCFINLAAIETNLKVIRHHLGEKVRIMPVIKANAYGTHHRMMAKFLESRGVDILCVSYVDEGVALRRSGVTQSVFAINAAVYEASKAVKWDLEVGVSDLSLIQALSEESVKQSKITKVHLHVDTGMSRLGCRKEEAFGLAKEIACIPGLKLEGLMTHFACADDPREDSFSAMQIADFDHVIAEIEASGIVIPWKHAANSSAAIRFRLPQYNMARIGLALYGLNASKSYREVLELKLALSLQSKIVGINICKKGEAVGYGRNYLVERELQRIAIIPIGYFDGLHRHYSGKGTVMIHGIQAPMVGNICMDYLMVDITDIPDASTGDPVLIFGEDEYGNKLSPEQLAYQGNSIVHELVACLGPRIQRVFIHEENASSC